MKVAKGKLIPVRKMPVRVEAEGEMVAIQFGNATVRMGYEDALVLSQWVRMRAKQAKQFAGDDSRKWRLLANLDSV